MIPRYSVDKISEIWSDQNRFQQFLKVELALLNVLEHKNIIPTGTSKAFDHVNINPSRILEIEAVTRHDVIAFCSSITEQVDAVHARFFHYGVTSSDILDTALALQIKASLECILNNLNELILAIKSKVDETKDLLCIGRSHGMHAEPMIFAQKFLSFEVEFSRRIQDYKLFLENELTGQISGAVGNYTILDPEIEIKTLNQLKLNVEKVSSQVVPRDHLAKLISIGALTATALERMAVEFRLLHHSDVSEVYEGFKQGQKGSSTMPHKKNPVSSENISGLARVIRSHFEVAAQNCVLWHERDISHSSAERIILPDHFGLLAYSLNRMTSTVKNLNIERNHIESKAINNFKSLSSYILHELILINSAPREDLYALVQEATFKADSFDDLFNLIEASCHKNGFKTPARMSPGKLKQHYMKRFSEVLTRARS
jgi:adenylosuccinate lyase